MLYQLLEAVYGNIKHKERIPNSLHSLSVETITEKTFKDESIFINKLNGAMVEYVSAGESSILRSIEGELESLSKEKDNWPRQLSHLSSSIDPERKQNYIRTQETNH